MWFSGRTETNALWVAVDRVERDLWASASASVDCGAVQTGAVRRSAGGKVSARVRRGWSAIRRLSAASWMRWIWRKEGEVSGSGVENE